MAWLDALLRKPPVVVEEPVEEVVLPPVATGPELAVLVPDIAGISSFRLHKLPDARSAEEFIAGLNAETRRGVHAFWALHEKPILAEENHVEALTLIRARSGSDLVYIVSFLDIESAESFTRFEVRRGLHLENVMIYWASFVQIREELEGVSVLPAHPPVTAPSWLEMEIPSRAPEPQTEEPVVDSVAVEEPPVAPAPETSVEAQARAAIQRYLERADAEDRGEPIAAEPEIVDAAPLTVELPIADPEPLYEPEPYEPDLESAEPEPEAFAEAVPADAPEMEEYVEPLVSEFAEEQAAIEEATVFQHNLTPEIIASVEATDAAEEPVVEAVAEIADAVAETVELVLPAAPELIAEPDAVAEPVVEDFGAEVLTAPVVSVPGDDEMDPEAHSSRPAYDPASEFPEAIKLDDFDIAYEVERLLRTRKFERKDSPFTGFESPPGRF